MKKEIKQALENVGRTLILCDKEEEYAQLMTEYLKKQKDLPWEMRTYTDVQELLKTEGEGIAILVVAESAYCEELLNLAPARIVVLNESGLMRWENLYYVDKYQQADEVLRFLMEAYLEIVDTSLPRLQKNCGTVFIGNYSPVRRGMQTSLALTVSQLLAKEHATLYLNFEHYAGLAELVADTQTYDLADLLYFLDAEKEKFRLRLQSMLKHIGDLDYVPPMKSGQNLLTITEAEWLKLFQKIVELGEYEFVILDLSESMQGLFQILRLCKRIYTVTREDRIAKSKLLQYEQLLAVCDYNDVLDKTKQLSLTHIRRLPESLELLTRGELADLAQKLIEEIIS